MDAQGRYRAAVYGVFALVAAWAVTVPLEGSPPGLLPVDAGPFTPDPMASDLMRADARLAGVSFADPQHGWAVGDRGTIWHTDDGGQTWQLQESGVACRLQSVFFLDQNTGWAAGGYSHPYTHTSSGVVLRTRDGGRRWSHAPKSLLPALRQIRFFDARQGWAIGCPSAMFPSGLFVTEDGGRSWRPLPGERAAGWMAGDFLAPHDGVLADRTGMAATLRRGQLQPARTPRFGLRGIERMELVGEVEPQLYGWLVGQGGLVMWTHDLGVSWQTPQGQLPEGIPQQFDFAALAVIGPRVWVAGSPGTRVLHTADAGRSWTAFSTGQSLPIKSLCFVDDQHGWAVGELGTILATRDGGQTWKRQRGGGTRAALLGLFSEPKDVPLELFARLSGNEGYLGAVETLNRRDLEVAPRTGVHRADRLHEAIVGVGACGARAAWRFPLRQEGLGLKAPEIVDGWNRVNDGRGLDELKAHVVRQIRIWRPEVIVTHEASPTGGDSLAGLVRQVVVEAVRDAADPTSHAEQITRAGLGPWQVKRVYARSQLGGDGAVTLSTTQLAERLGRCLSDVAAGPRGLLEDACRNSPQRLSFRLLVDHLPRPASRPDFFAGIVLYPGGEARRELLEPPAESIDLVRRIAQKRRNMRAILERTQQEPQGGVQLLAQAGDLTEGLDADGSAQVLFRLAQAYDQGGRWPMAAETYELLADRHPEHPLARAALVWLVQYYASGEAAWRVRGRQRMAVQQASAGDNGGLMVQQASAPAVDFSHQEDRPEHAAELGKQIERMQPDLFAEPTVRFPLCVADRRRGFPAEADRFYLTGSHSATRDAWWACARGEQWLAESQGLPPKAVLACARAPVKPLLDGRLDDAVWGQAKPAELRSPHQDDAQWPASVKLAYDDGFLYLAVEAREAPGVEYPIGEGPRPRDPDLSARDRVELLVDLDRDYTTYYRLSVDHRGWPREECWGDSTWSPTWFVAAASESGTWTVEAAIPLDQLTGQYPSARSVWAIGIQRIIPGVGFQSWNRPAAATVIPEGFGYLIFE